MNSLLIMKTTLPWYSGLQLLPSYIYDPWLHPLLLDNVTHRLKPLALEDGVDDLLGGHESASLGEVVPGALHLTHPGHGGETELVKVAQDIIMNLSRY